MPSNSSEISFSGESGPECEAFIQQLYAQAWREGHTWDSTWIAAFVSMCFTGKALRWYIKLPLETRRDWELLQQALSERWPSEDDESKPYPPAAAPPSISPSSSYKIGRLRAKVDGNDTPRWVSTESRPISNRYMDGGFVLTNDIQKALHTQFIPLEDQSWRLKMINHPSGCNLVAMYIPVSYTSGYGILIGVDVPQGESLREHRSTYIGKENGNKFKTDVWSFNEKEQSVSMHSKAGDKPGDRIYLKISGDDAVLLDNTPPPLSHPGIDLFFEPLDV